MKQFFKVVGILVALVLLVVGCWKYNYPTYAWRQKLTVTVSTPQGEVSGSSVSAVSWTRNFFSGGWGGAAYHLTLTDEAVVVPLGKRYLFALLRNETNTEYMGSLALASIAGLEGRPLDPLLFKEVRARRDRASGVIAVPAYQYPLLVTFADLADPTSVRAVDPHDLSAMFGDGYALKDVHIEVTDEPVTTGKVDALLGWLKTIKGRLKPIGEPIPRNYKASPEEVLYSIDFIQG